MLRQKVHVLNKEGLHARPAASLVKLATKFDSDFYIEMQGYRVNGKSILGVMTLAAEHGAEIELVVDGNDEREAMEALTELFESKFEKTN